MPIEPSVNWFSDYDINQPQDGDYLVEGDNHIRNLKKSILAQFPSLGDVAMTLTATLLNQLTGLTTSGAQINALQTTYGTRTLASTDDVIDNFPAGTRMQFQQAAAPTGWVKDTNAALNKHAIRIVTSTGLTAGHVGGGKDFEVAFATGVAGNGTALTTAQIPAHTHTFSDVSTSAGAHGHNYYKSDGSTGAGQVTLQQNSDTTRVLATSDEIVATGNHTHTVSGTTSNGGFAGNAHSHTVDMDVKYIDMIIGVKS